MTEYADVVLIFPRTGMDFSPTIAPPHALLSIAAPLVDAGYKVKIIDQRVDPFWDITLKKHLTPSLICAGISTMIGTQISFAIKAAQLLRNYKDGKIPIVWGGPHPSSLPEQTAESCFVDIVCVGEGEDTFLDIVNHLKSGTSIDAVSGICYRKNGRIILTPPRPFIDMEQMLPVPWQLVNVKDYIHPDLYLRGSSRNLDIGQTSRGCPYNCGFCSSAALRKRKWRPMSAQKSIEMIVSAVRRFKLTGFWLRDDEFYIDRGRANEICEGIIREKLNVHWYTSGTRVDVFNKASDEELFLLKRSGANVLKFGAESGSDRILKLMNKGICVEDTIRANIKAGKIGLIPAFALMMGFPTETFEEINMTVDLAARLKKDNPQAQFETIAPYTALPATPLFNLAIQHGLKPPGRLEGWTNWVVHEKDYVGRKLPWYGYEERMKIANLTYISILANVIPNLMEGFRNSVIRRLMKTLYKPFAVYFRWRFRKKLYGFVPELTIIRYLRKVFFMEGRHVVK